MRELRGQCEAEGRRRGEGEGEVRREQERAGELEREVREGREREEGLRGEIHAMKEVMLQDTPTVLIKHTHCL